MSSERNIIRLLLESREQNLAVYKGFKIKMDYDNIIHVYNISGKDIAQFENTEEAYQYIDELPLKEKNPPKNSRITPTVYYIYLKGTLDSRRNYAQYLSKKYRRCIWGYERNADTYTRKERDAIIRNSKSYDSYSV